MSERDLASRVGIPERMLPVPCVPIPFVGSITQFKTQVCEVGSPLGTTLYGPRFLAIRYLLILSHIESDIRIRRRDVRSGATRPRKRLKLSSKLYGYPTRRYELPDCNLRYTWDVSSIVLRTNRGYTARKRGRKETKVTAHGRVILRHAADGTSTRCRPCHPGGPRRPLTVTHMVRLPSLHTQHA